MIRINRVMKTEHFQCNCADYECMRDKVFGADMLQLHRVLVYVAARKFRNRQVAYAQISIALDVF